MRESMSRKPPSTIRLEPAATVLRIVGRKQLAEITGLSIVQVYRWTQPLALGGTDGRIPARHQPTILQWARDNHAPISAETIVGVTSPGGEQRIA